MGNSVLWIRNDFRFHDNTALINAINDIKDNENLIFIYHLDPELIKIETTSYAYFF
ncbi:TPA: deoxyribodipyrimidine photo-lyase, partial [Streptococcus suis]